MASLRKKFSKWTLGEQQSRSSKGINVEESAPVAPRKLHKALSTTFNYLANTVRQGATYIYRETETADLTQWSDGGTIEETPKKLRRRSSFFSSVRSRRVLFSPKGRDAGVESPRMPPTWTADGGARSPKRPLIRTSGSSDSAPTLVRSRKSSECPTLVCMTDGTAPTLDVQKPDSSWPVDTIFRVRSSSVVSKQWTSAHIGNMEDPFISRDDLSARARNLITSEPPPKSNNQYVEDTGYVAESESEAEQSGTEGFSPVIAPGPPASKPASRPYVGIIQSQIRQNNRSLPSDVYEADAELSETSLEVTPSMGSRTVFEHGLADRTRRYLAAIGHDTEYDNLSADPQFPQSPTIVPTHSVVDSLDQRLTDCEIMALGANDQESQGGQQESSNSDTDFSDSSPLKHAALMAQEDAYGAGMRAAGIVCPSYSGQPFSTVSEASDVTSDSCAVIMSSSSRDAPPPFPVLHVGSEPARQSMSAESNVLNATDKDEIPSAAPTNIGLHPSSPASFATAGDKVATDTPRSDSSPQRLFNAARLPSFGSPSIGSSPKSKRALRRQRKATRRATVSKSFEIDTMKSASRGELDSQPLFSVKHFEPTIGDPPPYAGHELDAVDNISQRKMACPPPRRETKGVSFAENEVIIGHSVIVRRLSPASSPQ